MTTIVGRICLDHLRACASRREEMVGTDIPESAAERVADSDPESEALLAGSLGSALLVVLDTLAPTERLAFVPLTEKKE